MPGRGGVLAAALPWTCRNPASRPAQSRRHGHGGVAGAGGVAGCSIDTAETAVWPIESTAVIVTLGLPQTTLAVLVSWTMVPDADPVTVAGTESRDGLLLNSWTVPTPP